MWSHKAIDTIQEGLRKIDSEMRKTDVFRKCAAEKPEPSIRKELLRLNTSIFELLAGGEELPYFRQNYIEISEHLFRFSDIYETIVRQLEKLCPEEQKALSGVSELFNTLGSIAGIFLSAWLYMFKDIRKSESEVKGALARILQLKDGVATLREQALSVNGSSEVHYIMSLFPQLIGTLYSIDFCLKKIIVLQKL